MAKPSRAQQTVTVNFQAKGERQLTNAIMLLESLLEYLVVHLLL